jgi:hypothetical protein
MLLDAGRYTEALAVYRSSLQRAPRRLNSLYGAAKAAIGADDEASAKVFVEEFLSISNGAGGSRLSIDEIRAIVKS